MFRMGRRYYLSLLVSSKRENVLSVNLLLMIVRWVLIMWCLYCMYFVFVVKLFGVVMYIKCKISCDLNVSYVYRRIDRIVFIVFIVCWKICICVSYYCVCVLFLWFCVCYFLWLCCWWWNLFWMCWIFVGMSVMMIWIMMFLLCFCWCCVCCVCVVYYVYLLFVIKIFCIDCMFFCERMYVLYVVLRFLCGFVCMRFWFIECCGSCLCVVLLFVLCILCVVFVCVCLCVWLLLMVVVDVLCCVGWCVWCGRLWDMIGGMWNIWEIVVCLNVLIDWKDVVCWYMMMLFGWWMNEDVCDEWMCVIEVCWLWICVGFVCCVMYDWVVDVCCDVKVFLLKG